MKRTKEIFLDSLFILFIEKIIVSRKIMTILIVTTISKGDFFKGVSSVRASQINQSKNAKMAPRFRHFLTHLYFYSGEKESTRICYTSQLKFPIFNRTKI